MAPREPGAAPVTGSARAVGDGPHAPAGALENLLILALLGAVVAAQLTISAGWSLLSRHLWLDEICTHAVVTDPDIGHAMRAISGGLEMNPPAYFLALRAFIHLAGRSDEVALRAFSLLTAVFGLAGLYAAMRLTFRPLVAFAAVLAVWCHHLIMAWAFEARFYAPWMAGVAWLAYLLASGRDGSGLGRRLLLALTAVFVCTVHYFGVLALGVVVGCELAARRRAGSRLWDGLGAAACGPLALLLWAPVLLQQRDAAAVATWVPAPTPATVWAFLDEIYLDRYLAVLAVAAWVAEVLRRSRGSGPGAERLGLQAGLTGLLLLPVIILALSCLFQPALVARYGLPAALGLGPVAAWLLDRLPRWALTLVIALLGTAATKEVGTWARQEAVEGQVTDQLIATLRTADPAEPVLFESPARLYMVWRYGPDVAARCALIDFEEGDIGPAAGSRVFVRDVARRFSEFYGGPRLVPWSEARRQRHAYLVGSFLTPGESGSVRSGPYPGFLTRTLSRELELYELIPAPTPATGQAPGAGGIGSP